MWFGVKITFFCILSFQLFAQKSPNIILIMTDDQGWGDLSCNGNTNLFTPNIDQLASEGIMFDRFFVAPVCSPTRAEVLTGRYHVRSGVYSTQDGGERMDLDEITIADVLKSEGYQTAAFGKWHNGMQPPYHPNARGFDEFYGFASGHWGNYFSPMLEHNGGIVQGQGFLPDDLTNHALEFIRKNRRKPFFLYLPYNTPHSPMQVPEKYWERQKSKPLQMFNRIAEQEDTLFTKAALAMVENIDDNVGRILRHLEKLKLEENTIVIFLSDNGPNGVRWNGGMKGKKGWTDEGGVRSPLIIRWKGHLEEGKKVTRIASGVDLFPTIIQMIGLEYQSKKVLDGIDILASTPNQDRVIYNYWNKRLSLRSQRFRLDDMDALFDMVSDPGQRVDVRFEFPEEYELLLRHKTEWLRTVASELPEKDDRPFTVGHIDYIYTQLPARDAHYTGNIRPSNRWSNCSFLTNWISKNDTIYWEVDVLDDGVFKAEVYYTCPQSSVGTTLTLSAATSNLSESIKEMNHPPLMGAEHDVVPRQESYVKNFRPFHIGNIDLKKGKQRISLSASNFQGQEGIDFRLLMLTRQ